MADVLRVDCTFDSPANRMKVIRVWSWHRPSGVPCGLELVVPYGQEAEQIATAKETVLGRIRSNGWKLSDMERDAIAEAPHG